MFYKENWGKEVEGAVDFF